MKAGWEVKRLGDVTQKLETVDPRKQPQELFTYIDVSSVSKQTLAVREVSELLGSAAPSRARRMVRAGDTIFATIRPTLKRIAHIGIAHDQAVCSTGYMVLRPISELEPRFVYYYLQSANFSQAMEALQKGASYPAVTDAEVRSQPIPLPPLEEQKRIVSILDEAFEGLDHARENAEANLKSARELLSARLAFVFSSAKRTRNAAHVGLEIKALGDICEIIGGGTPSKDKPQFYSGHIPWATVRDMAYDHLLKTDHSITESGLTSSSSKLIPKGEVIIASRVGLGKVCVLGQDTAINQDLRAVIPKNANTVDRQFLFYWFKSIAKIIKDEGTGATVKGVKLPFIKSLQIPLPPIAEQNRITSYLEKTSQECSDLQAQYNAKLQDISDLRQSLLQKAFAGELT